MRTINKKGIDLIKSFEGFRENAYSCPGGHWTIGYGHKIAPCEKEMVKITASQAEELLLQDLKSSEKYVSIYIKNSLTDNQFAALVSFTFNLGPAALQRSTLRQKINFGMHEDAADEFMKWTYCGGKKLHGLQLRRHAERALFML